jgi:hypothetical protein
VVLIQERADRVHRAADLVPQLGVLRVVADVALADRQGAVVGRPRLAVPAVALEHDADVVGAVRQVAAAQRVVGLERGHPREEVA